MTFAAADFYDQIADALVEQGYILLDHSQPTELVQQLQQRLITFNNDQLIQGGIGRDTLHQKNLQIRADKIHWLETNNTVDQQYLLWMDELRTALNRRLFLGLFDYEAHYAHYPIGAFYQRHYDAFKGRSNRVLTTVFYLNDQWQPADGGELVMYQGDAEQPLLRALPTWGRLLIFLSTQFPHEVLPAHRDRYSIAGWFRVNASSEQTLDTPR